MKLITSFLRNHTYPNTVPINLEVEQNILTYKSLRKLDFYIEEKQTFFLLCYTYCYCHVKISIKNISCCYSIAVLNTFANVYSKEKQSKNGKQKTDNNSKTSKDINIILSQNDQNPSNFECGKSYEDGLRILEALSATGLRSIRYAKEIAGIKEIIANDISIKAVESINANIKENGVDSLVKGYQNDAT